MPKTKFAFIIGLAVLGIFTVAAVVNATDTIPPAPPTGLTIWELVWYEEFDGNQLNASKGNIYDGVPDNAQEVAYFKSSNVFVKDGYLYIESKKESYKGYEYTSGKVDTFGKAYAKYGRIEARVKVPKGKGYWPAFWLLPEDKSWPPEIDIFEILGKEPNKVYMTNHWKRFLTPQYVQGKTMWQGVFEGPDFSADFHIFVLEWTAGQIRWLIDGVERHVSTIEVPDKEMYLILETQIGSDWPGYPDDTTIFPQDFIIDYVRIYSPNP